MLKLIYPPKIVDGFTHPHGNSGYQLIRNEQDTPSHIYDKYQFLIYMQTQWDKKIILQNTVNDVQNYTYRQLKSGNKYLQNFKNILPVLQFSFATKPLLDSDYLTWHQYIDAHQQTLNARRQVLSNENFEKFVDTIEDYIKKNYITAAKFRWSYNTLAKFIKFYNHYYILEPYHYPIPQEPKQVKVNPLRIGADWLHNGKNIKQVIDAVHCHWQTQKTFTLEQTVAWLVFSGIVYGGINNKNWLLPWLHQCLNNKFQPFIDYHLITTIRYSHPSYGNERVEYNERSKDQIKSKMYNSQQIVLDRVSQCWLIHYHQIRKDNHFGLSSIKDIEQLLKQALSSLLKPLGIKVPTLINFLGFSSYHWEMLPGVSIDQASVGVLQGDERTTGLMAHDFITLMDKLYVNIDKPYSLQELLKLSINAKTYQSSQKNLKTDYRKADIVSYLKKILQKTQPKKSRYPKFCQSSLQWYLTPYYLKPPHLLIDWFTHGVDKEISILLTEQRPLYEKIIVQWVILLLKSPEEPKRTTIDGYLGVVGYEWCYFYKEQDIEGWDEEDFTDLYEDILEHKAIERGNTDIQYSAKLLQRLHKVAEKYFDFPSVTIKQAKSQIKVRSEWVSPQAYYATLNQIKISIDSVERDMLMSLFILAYRTGMRKKELLGLKINDIEGLKISEPSAVLRPNSYRKLKTEISKRRVPIFALLTPTKLRFFNRYVRSRRGQGEQTYIFSLSTDTQPLPSHVPLQLFKKIMEDISNKQVSFAFHGFRHTAITNLALVLNARSQLATALTGYSDTHISTLRRGVLGVDTEGPDKWYALSGIMGHLSVKRSFEYYHHAATLMGTFELAHANIRLPASMFTNITGIKNQRIKENKIIAQGDSIPLRDVAKLLFKDSTQRHYKNSIKHPIFTSNIDEPAEVKLFDSFSSDELLTRYGIKQITTLLNEVQNNYTIEEAASKAILMVADAEVLIYRAKKVAAITTTTPGHYRFVLLKDQITPMRIYERIEYKFLDIFFRNIMSLRRDNNEDYQWYLTKASSGITAHSATISFPEKSLNEFKRFLMISTYLLPNKKAWLVTSNKKLIEAVRDLAETKNMKKSENEEFSTWLFGICIPDKHENNAGKIRYSSLLRFIVHIMLIMDEEVVL